MPPSAKDDIGLATPEAVGIGLSKEVGTDSYVQHYLDSALAPETVVRFSGLIPTIHSFLHSFRRRCEARIPQTG
jgi:hypothetical protein